MNEKIIQVITKGDQVMGLTSSGHLARFDPILGAWVVQSKSEVYTKNHELVANHVTIDKSINARKMAIEASSIKPPEVVHKETNHAFIYIMMAMGCTLGLIAILILKYLHIF